MPTLLDSLVIQLTLDGKDVATGAQQAGKSLKSLEGQADHTAGTLSDAGKTAADGFSQARTEALALLAVFTGGRSLKAFTSEITRTNAELGYTAQRLNMDPGNLYRMQQAIKAVGGDASEVASSFQTMQQMMVNPASAAQLQTTMGQLGLKADDYADANGNIREDLLKRLNRSTQGMNQTAKNSLLQSLGMGPGEINLIDQTTDAFDKLQNQFKGVGPTAQQIKDSQQLLKDWTALTAQTAALGRSILGDLMPGIDSVVVKITEWEKANPELAKEIGEVTLGVVALGTALGALATAKGVLTLLKLPAALKAANAAKNGETALSGGGLGMIGRAGIAGLVGSELWHPTDAGGPVEQWALKNIGDKGKTGSAIRWFFGDKSKPLDTGDKFSTFADKVSGIESGGRYDLMGGAGGKYAGKYQMSRDAINDAAKRLHEDGPSTDQFLKDPGMQERYFRAYTDMNRAYLSSHDAMFSKLSEDKQLAILGYAHNQGAGGALKWMHGGAVGHDAFGTAGTKYSDAITAALATPQQQVAQNKTEVHVGDIHVTAHGNANGQQIARDVHTELKRILPHTAATGLA
ncbi:hypothetical protein MKW11_14700 [Gluconobacter frateurii]|uniref:hypothetical protein n=1 Tax=Gluconobacter frateurii TaxID=38308 RepID=UPI001F06A34E|nr:hypothetical protein [Gluconobacter frateurii]UMM08415.1 hypothetical protein MKW11_14700 [Gluconobacter frateurii]